MTCPYCNGMGEQNGESCIPCLGIGEMDGPKVTTDEWEEAQRIQAEELGYTDEDWEREGQYPDM